MPVLVRSDASGDDADLVRYCMAMAHAEHEHEPGGFACYFDELGGAEAARARIRDELRGAGVLRAVVQPLRILRWDEEQGIYDAPDRMGVPDRHWRVTIPFTADMGERECELLHQVLLTAAVDADASSEGVTCYAEEDLDAAAVRVRLTKALRAAGLAHLLPEPLPLLRWDRTRSTYVDLDGRPPPTPLHPNDIAWIVVVTVRDVFAFSRLLDDLAAEGRTVVRERDWVFDVGAEDEQDALEVAARLDALAEVASAVPRELSAFGRWRVRQLLLGNYGEPPPGGTGP